MIKTIEKKYNIKNQFSNYQITYDNGKILYVPLDTANTDYQAIQKWIKDGNTVIDNGGNN